MIKNYLLKAVNSRTMISKIQGFFTTNRLYSPVLEGWLGFYIYKQHKIKVIFLCITLNALDNFKGNKYHCY